jgi:hypothetical protein
MCQFFLKPIVTFLGAAKTAVVIWIHSHKKGIVCLLLLLFFFLFLLSTLISPSFEAFDKDPKE